MGAKPMNVDEYMATLSEGRRAVLEELRKTILSVVPGAEEYISYNIPSVKVDGRPLLSFASWKNHCSMYPLTAGMLEAHGVEIERYETSSKGTIRFLDSQPLPHGLVKKLVKVRLAELRRKV